MSEPDEYLDLSRQLLAELNVRKREIAQFKEPIAIVGMACRFPGAADLSAFWHQLEGGLSAVTKGRPDAAPAVELDPPEGIGNRQGQCQWGAFIDGIDRFDAEFFRIAPVEARLMDPQQRLLLETSWKALEDAGIDPGSLKGSRTAVVAGICGNDYRDLIAGTGNDDVGLYMATGNSDSTAIGRIAFTLGLQGPAIAVDTACSSSLVAVHQAAAGLQRGESDLALAGGVSAILSPVVTEAFREAGMLSPDGRCKTFDASADGYVRGEGCGVVVLKRLSDAESDGDRVWAVIRGSAVNQDGASAGLTVPNGPAQERVIEEALDRAGVDPSDVDYLEAHGTGTELGDPIEVNAAASIYGRGRTDKRPLLIGSVKTNIGHLEASAGIAGLIKVALAMRHGVIPQHLHFKEPNPRVDWDRLPVRVTADATEWPLAEDRPMRAGVSSFGYSGTNAHVVVEASRHSPALTGESRTKVQADGSAGPARPVAIALPESAAGSPLPAGTLGPRGARVLPLSGRSADAVRDLAAKYLHWLDEREAALGASETAVALEALLADMAWTASVGRSHFEFRSGVVFGAAAELRRRLEDLADADAVRRTRTAPKVAFAFTGQGSQWAGMGRSLYETEPVARAVLDRCDAVIRDCRGASLLDVIFGLDGAEGDLDDTAWTQPALYALECALAALWESVGIRPMAVLGHSVGELAAARVAGVWSLEDGLAFAARRGELMAGLSAQGAMAAVFAPAERVAAGVRDANAATAGGAVSVAADNGSHQVVSGPAECVAAIAERFAEEGVRVERLNVARAFHSELMDPVLDELEASLAGVSLSVPSLPLVSNVTGRAFSAGVGPDSAYWRRQARDRVAFAEGVSALAAMGVDTLVEIGPRPVLGPMAELAWPSAAAPEARSSLRVVASLDKSPGTKAGFAAAVARIYESGATLSFQGLFGSEARRRIALPAYPFQRRRYWIEPAKRKRPADGHPLLGLRRDLPGGEVTFETELSATEPAWLGDHRVFGLAVAPGALHVALAISAGARAVGRGSIQLEDFELQRPLVLSNQAGDGPSEEAVRTLQIVVGAAQGTGSRKIEIFSAGEDKRTWTLHAEARLTASAAVSPTGPPIDVEALKAGLLPHSMPDFYRLLGDRGIEYGLAFRGVGAVWTGDGEAIGVVALPGGLDASGLEAHPAQLDGCFQVLAAIAAHSARDTPVTYLPIGWERLSLARRLPESVICHARLREADSASGTGKTSLPEVLTADLRFYDEGGGELGEIRGFAVKRATRAALLGALDGAGDLLYETIWREAPHSGGLRSASFLAGPAELGERSGGFAEHLEAEGVQPAALAALQADLDGLARACAVAALERLGWRRDPGDAVIPDDLRRRLKVVADHERLFRRLLSMLAEAGVLADAPGGSAGWVVAAGQEDSPPDGPEGDTERLAASMLERHPRGTSEIGLLARCGKALADVLRGRADPVALLFGDDGPSAADLYRTAPALRAANRLVGDVVAAAAARLPEGRHLRVIEVGAGTGSATAAVLGSLPAGRFDYTYTDVSAGFFAAAEERFGQPASGITYRVLDIEADPAAQGFDPHGYDLVIAANVLHATRDLCKTLAHCRELLAPGGELVALEGLRAHGWLDLTFGLLDGWWRFDDRYRGECPLAGESAWREAFADAGFGEVAFLGGSAGSAEMDSADQAVIAARVPAEVEEPPGLWVLVPGGAAAASLAEALTARNQTVMVASGSDPESDGVGGPPGAEPVQMDAARREAWRSLLEGLPQDPPFRGVVHLASLEGHGTSASTAELAGDLERTGATALALLQGLVDADAVPRGGVWFVTRGGQVVERERSGEIAGAALWGLGQTAALELAKLRPRMIDLDPGGAALPPGLVDELLYPDRETHVAYRPGGRYSMRVVREGAGQRQLRLPSGPHGWRLARDPGGALDTLHAEEAKIRPPGTGEVRIAIAATGLSFHDVLVAMGILDPDLPLGGEACGRIVATGPGVTGFAVGDRVTGFVPGALASEALTTAELVAPAPPGIPAAALATVPSAFVTAALAFELAGLKSGQRVLIHAGAGGVGQAAIQLARATGAEVIATASAPKQPYLRSLGVEHVFDSRQTEFAQQVLEITDGAGVGVVLNSLTGPGFIEASLSCLEHGGRFVEIGRRDIWEAEDMAALRPDVGYSVLALDSLILEDPARVGAILRQVVARLEGGELRPLDRTGWGLAETGAALQHMRAGRHLGKVVVTVPPLAGERMREDGTYLVTGGLGGIGREIAAWLADRGARSIVLNARREPDSTSEAAIASLRERGVDVRVELADVTDPEAVDRMLERVLSNMPPLAGVIHSVGVLADGSLPNQSWERFEAVMWPKVLGAWQLHRATEGFDLDFFVLFSSMAGVLGSAGQANHAAANAFLDQLARHRRASGLPGQSIAWGAWSGLGEAEEQRARIAERMEAAGVAWITPRQGLRAFERLVREGATTSLVAPVDWEAFSSRLPAPLPILEDLLSATAPRSSQASVAEGGLAARLRQSPDAEREQLLVAFLQAEIQAILRLPSPPEPTAGFFDLGMDSLMAVELRNRINQAFSGEYEPAGTVVFDYPDTASLARHLVAELGSRGEGEQRPERRAPIRIRDDRIAIVGMACRFPGAPDLEAFWRQLEAGGNSVAEGRPDAEAAPTGAFLPAGDGENGARRWGCFIEGIDGFDAEFFRIAPVEARLMDPQQRLLLETAWQSLEEAGIDAGQLRGSRTAVVAGVASNDYRELIAEAGRDAASLYMATGNSDSTAIGRIAFTLGLEGPAIAVDTACSSSLVAVHQAAAVLQRGEADLALAGGVNAMLSPVPTEAFARAGMLAPDGRCKTFDAKADGFVRGEGCGVVVLKRLGDAEADGDRIWAVIRGSAVNQDGASAGLTVPNGPAQVRVIEEALARAGLEPADVDYLEAHGTGTELGDPIEARAAASAYGRGRAEERPLLIGTVKTNIGHLEAAAGVAGLIKVALSMRRGVIPEHLHFSVPNPRIDWDRLPLRVTSEAIPWPETPGRPVRAGVSSFGYSGTNAHVVLEAHGLVAADGPGSGDEVEGPALPVPVGRDDPTDGPAGSGEPLRMRGACMLPLSGRSAAAVRELAGRYLSWLDDRAGLTGSVGTDQAAGAPGHARAVLADMAWTAGVGRSHFGHRAGVSFAGAAELRRKLERLAAEGEVHSARDPARVAFVFTGQGSQWPGMGLSLYESEPIVRAVLDRCESVIRDRRGASLLDVMFGRPEAEGSLDDTAWTQPALYALEAALTELWASVGVKPVAVLGHSVGELAAAGAAGVFALEDGLRFAAARGELMASLPTEGPSAGAMLAVFAPMARLEPAIDGLDASLADPGLSVAADNGTHRVVSGAAPAVDALAERLAKEGVRTERLNASHAFHSALMDPVLDDLEAAADGIDISAPAVTLVSNLSGRAVGAGELLDGAYWRRHARERVAFADGVAALADAGAEIVVEIGPRPVVGPLAALSWPTAPRGDGVSDANRGVGHDGERDSAPSAASERAGGAPVVVASLHVPSSGAPSASADGTFAEAAARAYEAGAALSFAGLFEGEKRRKLSLPTYPFQRQRHWVDPPRRRRIGQGHPLLGLRRDLPAGEITFETEMFASDPDWLGDHRVFGMAVAPGALFGGMGLAAAVSISGPGGALVEDLRLHRPLVFPDRADDSGDEDPGRTVQLIVRRADGTAARDFEVFSRGPGEGSWMLHAEARLAGGADAAEAPEAVDLEALKSALSPQDALALYPAAARRGVQYGPPFRGVDAVWSGEGEALGEISLPPGLDEEGLDAHPAQIDACFQVLAAIAGADSAVTYLPVGWERLWFGARMPQRVVCHARIRPATGSSETGPVPVDSAAGSAAPAAAGPEVVTADLRVYDEDGIAIGGIGGLSLKRATRAALLSAVEGVGELLHELAWRKRPHPGGLASAGFLARPHELGSRVPEREEYLAAVDVSAGDLDAFTRDLERLAQAYALRALERLGWDREAGASALPAELRSRLKVVADHERLFHRLFGLLAEAGLLVEGPDDAASWLVAIGSQEALPDEALGDPSGLEAEMRQRYPFGSNELGLLARCGSALAEVLRGRAEPLALLFASDGPSAASLYRDAPVMRAANRMVGDAVSGLAPNLPAGRRLRVLEIGAGTGSTTDAVLAALEPGRFDYVYTDVSAGFFAEAEERFRASHPAMEFRVLDIETDPAQQGFAKHGYDLIVAANVLHATRDLGETLAHCRDLLAPQGVLVALEGLRRQGWLDLTFGLLHGWWRFADAYRPDCALAGEAVWRRALEDVGFDGVTTLGNGADGAGAVGVIVACGPAQVVEAKGAWVLAANGGPEAGKLAAALAERNQYVVVAGPAADGGDDAAGGTGITYAYVDPSKREAWRALVESLPVDAPLAGVVHLGAVDGRGAASSTAELAEDTTRAGASALALVQGLLDAEASPAKGVWLVTRGAQIVEREQAAQLAGAPLWGLGRTAALEAPQLRLRMIDLDHAGPVVPSQFVDELLFPDMEQDAAYRGDTRYAARLVQAAKSTRLRLPDGAAWRLARDPGGSLEALRAAPLEPRPPGAGELLLAVDAAGLNFHDVLVAMGVLAEAEPDSEAAETLGGEACGRVLSVGRDVTEFSPGDRVVGFVPGAFAPQALTRAELLAKAPDRTPAAELATVPAAFVTAKLAFGMAGLAAGERVLIHAAAGGVGLAAIQVARAAGAEVFATASAPKRDYLRALGVEHVFDSRQTGFEEEILGVTGGEGVAVVLNSLTGPGFIEATLACLAPGGRFVEIARRGARTADQMAAARPDVDYHMLALDHLTAADPGRVGEALRDVLARIEAGELEPLAYSAWPLAEAGEALRFMQSGRHVGKLVLTVPPLASGRLREDATYLVTGGLGGIGRLVAGWLADRGARTIVLNGRREPDGEAAAAVAALRERGVKVRVEIADVADPAAVDAMLDRIEADLPPLAGVIHSVGALADASLANQSWERFERLLGPKMLGAWHLHRATLHRDLDLFVLFSSMTGVLGNAGQANHAAANAFLDQLARHRRALGLAGQSIAWGAWLGLGEAEEQRARLAERFESVGAGWVTPRQGLRALDGLLRQDVATSAVTSVDWSALAARLEAPPPLLEEVLPAPAGPEPDPRVQAGDLLARVGRAPAAEREALLVAFLQEELQAVLRLAAPPEPTAGFFDLGMDSLMAVELRNRLNRVLSGRYAVSNTLVFDYPNAASLGRHLASELGMLAEASGETQARAARRPDGGAIAIVGLACRFPGGEGAAAFWRQLEAGGNAVTEGRPGSGPEGSGDGNRAWGAFIGAIDRFDAEFFRIAPVEARLLDPQQRLLLETSWEALEDAGIDPGRLRGSRTGVYAGLSSNDYRDLIAGHGVEEGAVGLYVATGNSDSTAIGRIAFTLGLEGPAVAVDTACSSSLVAVHHAAAALQRGEADLVLAGGANAILSSFPTEAFAKAGMLAPDGQCKTFDAAADGFVRGEGCGVIVLKRLADAEADGDRIQGVIRGSAVNQDGASAGLTVPNGPAQERVIEEALARSGLDPSEVDYLEAHGTGTELGDPIEVHAAAAVYGRGRGPDRPLLTGSVKTNVGHLEAAAGIAGLIKVVLSMSHGVIPRHLHFRKPNPRIDWDRLPVRVVSEASRWPTVAGRPMRAAVSSFGLSGTNAHMIVEAYGTPAIGPADPDRTVARTGPERPLSAPWPDRLRGAAPAAKAMQPRPARVLPLSGRSALAVRELAGRYLSWLDDSLSGRSADGPDSDGDDGAEVQALLADMAWTAGQGRSHFRYRAGVAFAEVSDLRRRLEDLSGGAEVSGARKAPKVAFVFTGQGSQWAGMGRSVYESEPVARAILQRCDDAMRALRGVSLLDVMFGEDGAQGDLDDTAWTQPALYALECAMAALWAGAGVRPAAVLGHSVGELPAAQFAGAFSLEDGLRFAAARGELMAGVPVRGAMAAVFAPAERVHATVERLNAATAGATVSVAADNGAHQVVSGPVEGVENVAEEFAAEGVRVERLNTSQAFHSELMDPILDRVEEALEGVPLAAPTLSFVSNLTGRATDQGAVLDGAYWRRQAREPVAFADSVATLARMRVDLVVEIGPQPVLGPMLELAWPAPAGGAGRVRS